MKHNADREELGSTDSSLGVVVVAVVVEMDFLFFAPVVSIIGVSSDEAEETTTVERSLEVSLSCFILLHRTFNMFYSNFNYNYCFEKKLKFELTHGESFKGPLCELK